MKKVMSEFPSGGLEECAMAQYTYKAEPGMAMK
jgi:hypothetical protein